MDPFEIQANELDRLIDGESDELAADLTGPRDALLAASAVANALRAFLHADPDVFGEELAAARAALQAAGFTE